jgi:hypothetical protein
MDATHWWVLGTGIAAALAFPALGFASMSTNPPFSIPKWIPKIFFSLTIVVISCEAFYFWSISFIVQVLAIISAIGLLIYLFYPLMKKRIKKGKRSEMLIGLGIIFIIGGMLIIGFQLNLKSEPTDIDLRTFSYDNPPLEHLDPDMDFTISGYEMFGSPQTTNMYIIMLHVTATNRSSSAKNIVANMKYEFRLKEKKEAYGIPFMSYEPPDADVTTLKAKFESEKQYSIGEYLKFPLLLESQKSVKGFMLFYTSDGSTLDRFSINGMLDPTIDTRVYLEWDNLLTNEHFRILLF